MWKKIDKCLSKPYNCINAYSTGACDCGNMTRDVITNEAQLQDHFRKFNRQSLNMKNVACKQDFIKDLSDESDSECPNDGTTITPIICLPPCPDIPIAQTTDTEGSCCKAKHVNAVLTVLVTNSDYNWLMEEVAGIDMLATIDGNNRPSDTDSGSRRIFDVLMAYADRDCDQLWDEGWGNPMRYCVAGEPTVEIDIRHACEETRELKCQYENNLEQCNTDLAAVCTPDLQELYDKCVDCCTDQNAVTNSLLISIMQNIKNNDNKRKNTEHRIQDYIPTDCSAAAREGCCRVWCRFEAFTPGLSAEFDEWKTGAFENFLTSRNICESEG